MSDRADRIEGVHYDGARVPQELMGVLADASALLPSGLTGTLTLDGKLATVKRGEGAIVVVEPLEGRLATPESPIPESEAAE